MSLVDRYISFTVASVMALATLALLGLFIVLTLIDQAQGMINQYNIFYVVRFVAYSLPRMLYEVVPYAAMMGCIAGLGLLASSSELLIMRAAGLSTASIAWSAIKPALILVFVGMLVGEFLLPDFERMARADRTQAKSDLVGITERGGFWYREKDVYMHFDVVGQRGVLQGVSLYYFDEQKMRRSLFAQRGVYHDIRAGKNYWLLEDVTYSDFTGSMVKVEKLPGFEWRTSLTPNLISSEIVVQPDRMSIRELIAKITYMDEQGLESKKFELGFWDKVFQPIATLSLVLIGISFIFGPLRDSSMGTRVLAGVIVGITFKFLQNLISPASLVFGFSPIIAVLAPIFLCLLVGAYVLKRSG